jgi:hypothetical protein
MPSACQVLAQQATLHAWFDIEEAANWGGYLHEGNDQSHRDQGFDPGNGDPKIKTTHDVCRRELDFLAEH